MKTSENYSAKEINRHIDSFKDIYDKNGKEVNPVPEDERCCIWCEGSLDNGFACNVTAGEAGITLLIAQKWILETELMRLINSIKGKEEEL